MATPMGPLGIVIRDDGLEDVSFLSPQARLKPPGTPLERRICRQLRAYFANPRIVFDIPLVTGGTPFQQRVWRMLRRIPPGATWSYGELARRLRTSPRAVGNACRANPIPIVIPCHRVVASGYGDVQGSTSVGRSQRPASRDISTSLYSTGSRKLRATIGGFMGAREGKAVRLKHWLLGHERAR
jgi:methylated-DNA-[protein]-cysteine S-methyltransferase